MNEKKEEKKIKDKERLEIWDRAYRRGFDKGRESIKAELRQLLDIP